MEADILFLQESGTLTQPVTLCCRGLLGDFLLLLGVARVQQL